MGLKPASDKYPGVWKNELKNGDIAYYINYRDENGKPVKKKVGTKTRQSNFTIKDAYDRLIEIKHKLAIGQELPKESIRRQNKTLNDLYDAYIDWAKGGKKSWDIDKWYYEKHVMPGLGKRKIKTLKALDFENLKASKTAEGYAAQTVKHILQICRRVINFAIEHELVNNISNPLGGGRVKMPVVTDNKRQAFLTRIEARQLLEALPSSSLAYHLTVFALATGARFSEITGLRWQDINFETNTAYFKPTKNGNARYIVISELLKHSLEELSAQNLEATRFIFQNSNGNKIGRVPTEFEKAVSKIRLNNSKEDAQHKITFHSLRHTHASWLAMDGLDILHIKEQLGHKTLEMTMRYAHLIPNKRNDATLNLFSKSDS